MVLYVTSAGAATNASYYTTTTYTTTTHTNSIVDQGHQWLSASQMASFLAEDIDALEESLGSDYATREGFVSYTLAYRKLKVAGWLWTKTPDYQKDSFIKSTLSYGHYELFKEVMGAHPISGSVVDSVTWHLSRGFSQPLDAIRERLHEIPEEGVAKLLEAASASGATGLLILAEAFPDQVGGCLPRAIKASNHDGAKFIVDHTGTTYTSDLLGHWVNHPGIGNLLLKMGAPPQDLLDKLINDIALRAFYDLKSFVGELLEAGARPSREHLTWSIGHPIFEVLLTYPPENLAGLIGVGITKMVTSRMMQDIVDAGAVPTREDIELVLKEKVAGSYAKILLKAGAPASGYDFTGQPEKVFEAFRPFFPTVWDHLDTEN